MWNTQVWRKLEKSEIAGEVEGLRKDTLRLLLALSAAGCFLWHFVAVVLLPAGDETPYRSLFPIVVVGQVLTFVSLRCGLRLAVWCFLTTSAISVAAAIWLLESPVAALLYPVVALAAVVLLHPLAGLATTAATVGFVVLLRDLGPLAFLTTDHVAQVALISLLVVATAWALDRNLLTAIEWSLHSFEQALRSAQDAQNHRAQLVQALKQLDSAYYRLERANAALEVAWKAAESAERSKSEFVTNISHELRTPLNLIVGFGEMIVTSPESYGGPLPPQYRGDLNAIYRSAQHLLTLTDDVIDLARVGVGRMALVREPVDLGQVIRDACDIVREYVAAKGLYLDVEVEPGMPELLADRLRIRQVLLNLLTNASRFTERGGITVAAVTQEGRIAVRVVDTGAGIAPEDLPKVFQEFHTGDGGSPRRHGGFGGMGLGLPLSKRLVELHGGEMGVDSALGTGTTFWFTLPTVATEGASRGEGWRPTRLQAVRGSLESVLVVVGADQQSISFLRRHLRGYRIVPASSLAAARSVAVEHRASAILADAVIVSAQDCVDSPVPVLRLPLPRGDRVAAALGAIACMTKPVTRSDLRAAIQRLGHPIRMAIVVDDDPRFVRLMVRMLRSILRDPDLRQEAPEPGALEECEVAGLHNGHDALALMRERRPDLVLLDLVMPGMGGQDLLAAMAASGDLASVPVIVVSGQEPGEWRLPLAGSIAVERPAGFRLEEILGSIEALLGVLEPPKGYLTVPEGAPREAEST